MTVNAAVAAVQEAERVWGAAIDRMHSRSLSGVAYETAQRDEQTAWNQLRAARTALREHVYTTYGMNLDDLNRITR